MSARCEMTHRYGRDVTVFHGDTTLFRYVYGPDVPAREVPKPYLHPIHTLDGDLVTGFRPHDHPWHHGLAMTVAHLSGENFWGGPTFVSEQGYQFLENTGTQRHTGWQRLALEEGLPVLEHGVDWITHQGARWIEETRALRVAEVNPDDGRWRLETRFTLRNVAEQTLAFGSPTTEGRPNAGYGSLFWRGPRDFTDGTVRAAGGLEGAEQIRGTSAPWLAYVGKHDETLRRSTVVFADDPRNPRHPNKWFVRSAPIPAASFSFLFDEVHDLEPGETLDLRYTMIFANGAREAEEIDTLVQKP